MIAAEVTVFECDECGFVTAVRDDAEWTEFETNWHSGLIHDFCPNCRFKIKTQARILEDEKRRFHLIEIRIAEVLNAEYIN